MASFNFHFLPNQSSNNKINILQNIAIIPSEQSEDGDEILSQRSAEFKQMLTGMRENISRKKLIQNCRVSNVVTKCLDDLHTIKELPNLDQTNIEHEINPNFKIDSEICDENESDIRTQDLEDMDNFKNFLGIRNSPNLFETLINEDINNSLSLGDIPTDFDNFLGIPTTPTPTPPEILSKKEISRSLNVVFKPELVTAGKSPEQKQNFTEMNVNYDNISDDESNDELIPSSQDNGNICKNVFLTPPSAFQNSPISDDDQNSDEELPCGQVQNSNYNYIAEIEMPIYEASPPDFDEFLQNSVSIQTVPLEQNFVSTQTVPLEQNSISTQTNSKLNLSKSIQTNPIRNVSFNINKNFKIKNKKISKLKSLGFCLNAIVNSGGNKSDEEKWKRTKQIFDELIDCFD